MRCAVRLAWMGCTHLDDERVVGGDQRVPLRRAVAAQLEFETKVWKRFTTFFFQSVETRRLQESSTW